ncbi:MAG TPA: TonB-dependent receptor [Sphingobium sp.]
MTTYFLPTRRKYLLLAGASALMLCSTAPAIGAEVADTAGAGATASDDAVILVTARRREESAQDVPVALSVVSGDTLEKTGAFTINQIQQLVPSLQVVALNPRNSNINIRGLGSNSSIALDGLEYGFGFYVDSVYYARPGQAQFDMIDLERVEVLKGPQGTLFGKNTTAGAINITTRQPSFTPEATAEATLGNYGYHQLRASVSAPLVADKVAVRLSIADTHRDGFLTNRFDQSHPQDYDNFTVRGQLLVKPSDTLSIRLIGDYSNQKQHSLSAVEGYFTTYANGATIANNILVRAARTGYALLPADPFGRRVDLDAAYQHFMKSYGVSGEVNWDLGAATLTSVTAYRWWDWYPMNDVDGTSLRVQQAGLDNYQRQFSQEVRVASNGHNKVDYVAGLYYFWQVVRGYGTNSYGPDYARWNLNPATTSANSISVTDRAMTGFEADSYSNPSTKSYAAFGQADWHIGSAVTLTGGLRFTHEDKEGEFRQFWVAGLDLSTLSPSDRTIAMAARAPSAEMAFASRLKADALSGLATLSYKPSRDLLVYGTYARGNKSGGLNLTAGGAFQPVINPEKVDSFEIGLKSQFLDRRITLNTAAFLTNVRDYQTSILEYIGSTTNTRSYIANIPKVRSKGIEADLSVSPSRRVQFTASAAYTDARYVSYTNAPQATERANQGAIQDLSGARLSNIPEFAYSLGGDVAQPVGGPGTATEIYGHADFAHRSSTNASSTNSIYGIIPAYGLLNARIGLRAEDRRWDMAVWARNLTNQNYFVSRTGGNTGAINSLIGEPRTYGLTFRTKW